MKIAVLGAGAMGSLFGGLLAEAGFEVALIDVDDAHIEAVRERGLRLETDAGERVVRAQIGRANAFDRAVELLIVFTKAPHTAAALASVAHLISPRTCALTLQNGLGNGERLAEALPASRVLIGMTNWPSDVRAPGHVASHGTGEVRIWPLDGQASALCEPVRDALDRAGLNAVADPQVMVAIWEKAAFNAAMNSVSAITERTVGEMADDPDVQGLIGAVVGEVAAVAHARGLEVSSRRIGDAVQHAFDTHRSHKPSMLQDMLAGRPTEIESINGAIVEAGRRAGVAAPTVEALARLVRAKSRMRTCGK